MIMKNKNAGNQKNVSDLGNLVDETSDFQRSRYNHMNVDCHMQVTKCSNGN